jgi:hypothetical protein
VHLKRRLRSTQARCELNLDENMNSSVSCSCLLSLIFVVYVLHERYILKIILSPVNFFFFYFFFFFFFFC